MLKRRSSLKLPRVVHFRDVASLLSKAAVENKFPMAGDIKYESKLLETAILDLWLARYPGTLSSSGLNDMKEKYISQTVATLGRRYAGYDTKTYLAVLTSQRIYKQNKKIKTGTPIAKHRITDRIKEIADDINNDKLKICAFLNEENFDKVQFEDIIGKYKERKVLNKGKTKKSLHNASNTFSHARFRYQNEYQSSNQTLSKPELEEYLSKYGDIFGNTSKRRKSLKQPPQRMATLDENKWATAKFSNVIRSL
jgi:hypothetical protein